MLAERQIRITKLSEETDVSRTTLTSIANGKTQMVRFDTLERICEYLKIPVSELFEMKGEIYGNNQSDNNETRQ